MGVMPGAAGDAAEEGRDASGSVAVAAAPNPTAAGVEAGVSAGMPPELGPYGPTCGAIDVSGLPDWPEEAILSAAGGEAVAATVAGVAGGGVEP